MNRDFKKILIFLLLILLKSLVYAQDSLKVVALNHAIFQYGGLVRADTTKKYIYLTFTGGEFNDGGKWIENVLKRKEVPANFFFTGDFYRFPGNKQLIKKLKKQGHYLGPHSDKHLLYVSWENRDSLLVSREEFINDLINNFRVMNSFGISRKKSPFFMPPYEWYNQVISSWAADSGLILVNYTPGTRSNADYTTPDMGDRYVSSDQIHRNILKYEKNSSNGLNGSILLLHIGTAPERTDKFYFKLEDLLTELKERGYQFKKLTELLNK